MTKNTKVICISNQKGGVGKSTTALCLASTLGFKSKKTLLIDLDGQGNSTFASGIDAPEKTVTDVLGKECRVNDAIMATKYYDLLPADGFLINVERATDIKPTLLLKTAIIPIQGMYDYIVIDTPPALGNLLYNGLVAADYAIIPCEPSIYALQGLSALNRTIQSVQQYNNKKLTVAGILLIKYNIRTVLSRDIKDMIQDFAQRMNTEVFKTTIREAVAVKESQTVRKPLIDYSRNSKPNIDYKAFTSELLRKIGG